MDFRSDNTTAHLALGTVLHGSAYDYTIEDYLGHGSFGITYKASVGLRGPLGQLGTKTFVAIKEFFLDGVARREGTTLLFDTKATMMENYRKKFRKEALNLSKMEHEGIVKILETFDENDTSYFVMEYIDGPSLEQFIFRRGRLSPDRCAGITRGICHALEYMHSHSMLHLDLKPGNIMLRGDGRPVLIDFGLSKCFDDDGTVDTLTMIGNGTSGYAPLEQIAYSGEHSGKLPVTMDIYALGGTMYKMLTGVRPPEASTVLNEGFPKHELELCGGLKNLMLKAMSPVVRMRYQNIGELLADLPEGCGITAGDISSGDKGLVAGDEITGPVTGPGWYGPLKGDEPTTPLCCRDGRYIWDYLTIKLTVRETFTSYVTIEFKFSPSDNTLKINDREFDISSFIPAGIPESVRKFLGIHPSELIFSDPHLPSETFRGSVLTFYQSPQKESASIIERYNGNASAIFEMYRECGLHDIVRNALKSCDSNLTGPSLDPDSIGSISIKATPHIEPDYMFEITPSKIKVTSAKMRNRTVRTYSIRFRDFREFINRLNDIPFRVSPINLSPAFNGFSPSELAQIQVAVFDKSGNNIKDLSLYESWDVWEKEIAGGNVLAKFDEFEDYLRSIIPKERKGLFGII